MTHRRSHVFDRVSGIPTRKTDRAQSVASLIFQIAAETQITVVLTRMEIWNMFYRVFTQYFRYTSMMTLSEKQKISKPLNSGIRR